MMQRLSFLSTRRNPWPTPINRKNGNGIGRIIRKGKMIRITNNAAKNRRSGITRFIVNGIARMIEHGLQKTRKSCELNSKNGTPPIESAISLQEKRGRRKIKPTSMRIGIDLMWLKKEMNGPGRTVYACANWSWVIMAVSVSAVKNRTLNFLPSIILMAAGINIVGILKSAVERVFIIGCETKDIREATECCA